MKDSSNKNWSIIGCRLTKYQERHLNTTRESYNTIIFDFICSKDKSTWHTHTKKTTHTHTQSMFYFTIQDNKVWEKEAIKKHHEINDWCRRK